MGGSGYDAAIAGEERLKNRTKAAKDCMRMSLFKRRKRSEHVSVPRLLTSRCIRQRYVTKIHSAPSFHIKSN